MSPAPPVAHGRWLMAGQRRPGADGCRRASACHVAGQRRQDATRSATMRHAAGDLGMDEDAWARAGLAVAFAEQAVAAEVAVLEPPLQARVGDAQVGLEPDQLGRLLVGVIIHPADLLGQDQDPAVGVDDLGLEVGVFQVAAVGDRAVVGQQDRVGVLDVREHRVGERLRAGRLVRRDRHLAEEDLDLGQDALGDRLAGDGERRGMGRVAVHDRARRRPGPS